MMANEQESISRQQNDNWDDQTDQRTSSSTTTIIEDYEEDDETAVFTFGQVQFYYLYNNYYYLFLLKYLNVISFAPLSKNSYCELGHGDTQERHSPTLVEFCKSKVVIQVVAGNEHTAILCSDGNVYTCGYNDSGQCGIGSTGRVPRFVLVEYLRNKGIVRLFSGNGCEHFAALSDGGLLYTCGYNSRGQVVFFL